MENQLMGCPWSAFRPSEVDFCEANLCAWLVEPANSISCIGFVIAGIVLIRRAREKGIDGVLSWFGPIAIAIGVFSVALHGTMTKIGSVLDLGSMYLLATVLLLMNYRRILAIRLGQKQAAAATSGFLPKYIGTNAAMIGLLYVPMPFPIGIPMFGLMITCLAFSEIYIYTRKNRPLTNYRWFWATAVTFFTSLFVWSLDISRVLCMPDNHIFTGHSFWHFGNALAIYLYFRFYEQFERAA